MTNFTIRGVIVYTGIMLAFVVHILVQEMSRNVLNHAYELLMSSSKVEQSINDRAQK